MEYDTLYDVLLMAEIRKIYKVFDANGEILFYGFKLYFEILFLR